MTDHADGEVATPTLEELTERAAAADMFLLASLQTAWAGTDAPAALVRRARQALRGDLEVIEEYRTVTSETALLHYVPLSQELPG